MTFSFTFLYLKLHRDNLVEWNQIFEFFNRHNFDGWIYVQKHFVINVASSNNLHFAIVSTHFVITVEIYNKTVAFCDTQSDAFCNKLLLDFVIS